MKQKYITLPPRRTFKGFDYSKATVVEMKGKEWHQYAKADQFKISRDRDNRDATARGYEVWDVK